VIFSFALVLGLMLFLVSGLPEPLIAPALSQVLVLASLGAALVAVLWREPLFASHLTHWDKSAAFLGLSILAGFFVDPALVEQTIAELTGGTEQAASSVAAGAQGSMASPEGSTEQTGLFSRLRDLQ
jgi:hypothetical protein